MNGREKRRKRAERARNKPPINKGLGLRPCSNCGDYGSHFVPPGFGTPGSYICLSSEKLDAQMVELLVSRPGPGLKEFARHVLTEENMRKTMGFEDPSYVKFHEPPDMRGLDGTDLWFKANPDYHPTE